MCDAVIHLGTAGLPAHFRGASSRPGTQSVPEGGGFGAGLRPAPFRAPWLRVRAPALAAQLAPGAPGRGRLCTVRTEAERTAWAGSGLQKGPAHGAGRGARSGLLHCNQGGF